MSRHGRRSSAATTTSSTVRHLKPSAALALVDAGGTAAAGRLLVRLVRVARRRCGGSDMRILVIASSPQSLRSHPAPSPADLAGVSPTNIRICYAPDTNVLASLLISLPNWPLAGTQHVLPWTPSALVLVDPITICQSHPQSIALCASLALDACDRVTAANAGTCDLVFAIPKEFVKQTRPIWIHEFPDCIVLASQRPAIRAMALSAHDNNDNDNDGDCIEGIDTPLTPAMRTLLQRHNSDLDRLMMLWS